MKILITGANGFVGKKLQLHLAERKDVEVVCFTCSHDMAQLPQLLQGGTLCFNRKMCALTVCKQTPL